MPNLSTSLVSPALAFLNEWLRSHPVHADEHMELFPQRLADKATTDQLLELNGIDWKGLGGRPVDLRFTERTEQLGYQQLTSLLKMDEVVQVFTAQDQGELTSGRGPQINHNWKLRYPTVIHPRLGPLGDRDRLVAIEGGVLLQRHFETYDVMCGSESLATTYYIWAGAL